MYNNDGDVLICVLINMSTKKELSCTSRPRRKCSIGRKYDDNTSDVFEDSVYVMFCFLILGFPLISATVVTHRAQLFQTPRIAIPPAPRKSTTFIPAVPAPAPSRATSSNTNRTVGSELPAAPSSTSAVGSAAVRPQWWQASLSDKDKQPVLHTLFADQPLLEAKVYSNTASAVTAPPFSCCLLKSHTLGLTNRWDLSGAADATAVLHSASTPSQPPATILR